MGISPPIVTLKCNIPVVREINASSRAENVKKGAMENGAEPRKEQADVLKFQK
jgi:hypothetical protein